MENSNRLKIMNWVGSEVLPHEADVRVWLRRTLDPRDLEDVIQEAYCRISSLADVSHIRSGRAYLFTTARAVVLERLRRARIVSIETVSHGAWLGPMAMSRSAMFRASSFAEGTANKLVMYQLSSRQMNDEVQGPVNGASAYVNPGRLLEMSPDLRMQTARSANLFEAGMRSGAILMFSFSKASRNAGLPTEFVVYPNSGHTLTSQRLQESSAELNLAWFQFWLRSRSTPDATQLSNIDRWSQMRPLPVATEGCGQSG